MAARMTRERRPPRRRGRRGGGGRQSTTTSGRSGRPFIVPTRCRTVRPMVIRLSRDSGHYMAALRSAARLIAPLKRWREGRPPGLRLGPGGSVSLGLANSHRISPTSNLQPPAAAPPLIVASMGRQDKMNDNAPPRTSQPAGLRDERPTQSMPLLKLHKTIGVKIGQVQVGGGAPIVVQSMTMTDTADVRATAEQSIELAAAGSEMIRVTVNLPEAAAAVPEIKQRMLDAGCTAPLIGDFHYNGHLLLTRFSPTARARSTSTASTRATLGPARAATSSSRPSARWRLIATNRCASASTAARSTRSW